MMNQQDARIKALDLFSRRGLRRIAFASLLATAPIAAGCYGRFPMTHALYKMNGDVENKFVKNVVFWLLVWFPIYWFAQIGDAIIFNLIDFWTGSETDLSSVSKQGDSTVTLQSSEDRNTLFMTISKAGQPDIKSQFVRIGDGKYELRDEKEHLLGQVVRTPKGDLNLTDAKGRTLQTISVAGLDAAKSGI